MRQGEQRQQQHDANEAYGEHHAECNHDGHCHVYGSCGQLSRFGEVAVEGARHYWVVECHEKHEQQHKIGGKHGDVNAGDGEHVAKQKRGEFGHIAGRKKKKQGA